MIKALLLLTFLVPTNAFSYEFVDLLLRRQFNQSTRPTLLDLELGEIWYCSKSVEAAKGHYRYVQLWTPSFIFIDSGVRGQILSAGPIKNLDFYWTEDSLIGFKNCSNCVSGEKYNLKITSKGDLIYSVSYKKFADKFPLGSDHHSDQPWILNHYVKCEKPSVHNETNWESNNRLWLNEDF